MLEQAGTGWTRLEQAGMGRNGLEKAEIGCIMLEQAKITWNKLRQAGVGWNGIELDGMGMKKIIIFLYFLPYLLLEFVLVLLTMGQQNLHISLCTQTIE